MAETINPYRHGASLFLRRLKWDVNYRSWRSRARLRRLRNKHRGQKAVILCNGPSLLKVDFDQLSHSGVFTFGLNKINMLFDKTDFRPSTIVAVNPYVIEQNREFYNSTEIPLLLDSCGTKVGINFRENIAFLHSAALHGAFARDCSMSIFQGHTVTYVALQLAFHMGFSRVALVGCDHNFATKGPANKTVESGDSDPNHFDPKYFSGGDKWQLPDLFESEMAYFKAKTEYEETGRKIVNCTEGGKLEIFPRSSLESFLQSND